MNYNVRNKIGAFYQNYTEKTNIPSQRNSEDV